MRTIILSEIESYFNEEVDARQLFNQLQDMGDYLELKAYGECLRFDKDTGGLVEDE